MADTHEETGLLSPAPSDVSAKQPLSATLPVPRSHPLPPNSAKTTALINYLDDSLLNVTRRYAKSFAANRDDRGQQAGYTSFAQAIADIDGLLDVVWISATPSIQIPYLLTLGGHFRNLMHSFAFDVKSFVLARKFDEAFSQMLNAAQQDPSNAYIINTTDRVRIRSLAQETRFEMVEVASKSGYNVRHDMTNLDIEDSANELETTDDEEVADDESIANGLGTVYEKTLEVLGADLTSLPAASNPYGASPPPIEVEDGETIEL